MACEAGTLSDEHSLLREALCAAHPTSEVMALSLQGKASAFIWNIAALESGLFSHTTKFRHLSISKIAMNIYIKFVTRCYVF